MEWLVLLLVAVLIAMTYGRKFSSPAQSGPSNFPIITPDMIEPADKPLSRQDVLSAYRKLSTRHCEHECAADIDKAVNQLSEEISQHLGFADDEYSHIVEYERGNIRRIRGEAEKAHESLFNAADENDATILRHEISAYEEEIRNSNARIGAAANQLDDIKGDLRGFFVAYLNREIHGISESGSDNEPSLQPTYDYWAATEAFGRPIDLKLHLRYQKMNGQIDERDFDLREFRRGAEGYGLEGFCHLRKDHRSLTSQGVLHCVDRDTGEVIGDLPAYIEQHYVASGSAKFDDVCDEHDDELTVLFYFAKADGAMRPAEQAILVDYIASFIPEGKPSVAEIEQVVLGWRPPGKGAFWAAVRGIAERSTETLRKVIAVAEQMQATDNDTGKDEQLALNYMRKKLIEAEKSRQ